MTRNKKCRCRSCYWSLRNNSQNVAAVLHPKDNFSDAALRKTYLSDNTCYCKEKNIQPQLFSRPKKCVFIESDQDDDDIINKKTQINRLRRPSTHQNKNKSDASFQNFDNYNVHHSHLGGQSSTCLDEIENFGSNLGINKKLELAQSNLDQHVKTSGSSPSLLPSLKSSFHEIFSNNVLYPTTSSNQDQPLIRNSTRNNIIRSSTILPRTTSYDKTQSMEGVTDADEEGYDDTHYKQSEKSVTNSFRNDLKQLSTFRKDHYFETHSTEDLIKYIPKHTCVHRFALDARFLPEALNADVYGVSRCIICGEPMDLLPVNKEDERIKKNKNKSIFPHYYKYGLAPKKIYMGNQNNLRIEMILEKERDNFCKFQLQKRPNYFNTYALRYQKGVQ